MKKTIKLLTLFVSILIAIALCACGGADNGGNSGDKNDGGDEQTPGISFNTLEVNENSVYGVVSNDTTSYSFIDEVEAVGGAKYIVSTTITGTGYLPAKAIDLNVGDNTVYIIEMINDEPGNVYTVVIRRKPMYTITFETNGGTYVAPVEAEEGSVIAEPEISPERAGYTFTGWSYDFTESIMSDVTVSAIWKANEDTKYTVEYYLENVEKTAYELIDTDELAGTTDTTANAEIKAFEHFTYNEAKSIISGNIAGDGTLVLKVYYMRDTYTASNANEDIGVVIGAGTYVYGSKEVELTAKAKRGYEFTGWYSSNALISTDLTYTFDAEINVEARFTLVSGMENFYFTSTETMCEITELKDKTLTEIVIPSCVTRIGNYAFEGCKNLTSVTIGNGVTSIGDYAFRDCTGLTSVYISDIATWCNISFPGSYENPLYYAKNLYLNGELVTDLVIPDSVTSIGFCTFSNCTSLTSITIPDSVTSIGNYAFGKCTSLTSVTIPNSVTSICSSAFEKCTGLTSVTIPDSVTSIGNYAFYNCTSLTSVTIGNSVTSIGDDAFEGCKNLTSVTIGNGVTSIGDDAFCRCTSLVSVIIPDSVTSIGSYAFYDCTSLTSVTIPDNVTSIGYGAFRDCTSLTSIVIPNSVTSIGKDAFYNCKSLTIYCEATSKPSGWHSDWNASNRPVVWGYKGE